MAKSKNFEFDGGAATFLGTSVLAFFDYSLHTGYCISLCLSAKAEMESKAHL